MTSSDQGPSRAPRERTKVLADRAGMTLHRAGVLAARWGQYAAVVPAAHPLWPPEVTTMSKTGPLTMGNVRARYARRLGLDHNPLRRRSDRIETFVRLTILVLLLAAVPAGVLLAGNIADHVFTHQAQAQQASDHQVTAVLTQDAPMVGAADPYSAVETAWAQARWTAPNGTAHSGGVLVIAGSRKGSKVRVWINATGATTAAPVSHRDVMAEVAVTGMVTGIVVILLLLGTEAIAVYSLNRRRFGAWDAEWRATGPIWTDHPT